MFNVGDFVLFSAFVDESSPALAVVVLDNGKSFVVDLLGSGYMLAHENELERLDEWVNWTP